MKYIIFGGTFDPWTPAHEEIVRRLRKVYPSYQVVIVPTTVSWHRAGKKPLFPVEHRISIISERIHSNLWLADATSYSVLVDDMEIRMSKAFPNLNRGFIDTLQALVARWTSDLISIEDIKFVVGSDEWKIFDKWKNPEEILKIASPIVVNRGDRDTLEDVEVLTLDDKFVDISASKIRAYLKTSSYKNKFKNPAKGVFAWVDYCSDEKIWVPELVPPIRLLTTPIFNVYNIPSDSNKFRPIQVRAPDWVCVIVDATPKNGKKMVFKGVRQIRWGTGKEYDEFVTGVVDPGEPPMKAAQRELKEELGIQAPISAIKSLGSLTTNPGFMNNSMHYFYVKLTERGIKKTKQKLDPHEKLVPVDIERNELFQQPFERPALMMAGLTMLASAISKGEIK